MHRWIRALVLSVLVCSPLAAAAGQQQASSAGSGDPLQFVEIAGVQEFSGRLIARPVQPAAEGDPATIRLQAAQADAARQLIANYQVQEYVWQTDEYVFRVPEGRTENDLAAELMASGNFEYVHPDWIVYPVACPNDPRLNNQWHHNANRMNSCSGWDIHTGLPNITVALCDTGVRTTHEDLLLHRKEGYNAVNRVWENSGGQISDINGHGTLVTGCAAANGNNGRGVSGVGWNLSHRMLRVTNSSGGSASLSNLTHAARTAAEAGDKAVSVSYSGVDNSTVRSTATYVKSRGALLCWAAGNDSRNLSSPNRDSDDVIVVGATGSTDSRASFSAFGNYVDLFAPGVNVYTTTRNSNTSYGGANGTSFSTPLTAGLVGLIFSADPSLTPDEVEEILKLGCDDIGAAGVDSVYGYGRIEVRRSLELAASGPRVTFVYPNGLPSIVDPDGGTTFPVVVQADLDTPVSGTSLLNYNDGSGWLAVPLVVLGTNIYNAVFPPTTCGATVEFYFSTLTTDAEIATDPLEAPDEVYSTLSAGDFTTVAAYDFESADFWGVVNELVVDGAWERGVPAGNGSAGDPTQDYDGSGQCYLTGNRANPSDVDGGPTRLISPVFDLSGTSDPLLRYARWMSNSNQDGDALVVEVSSNAGASWVQVEAALHQPAWVEQTWRIADFVTPNSQFRVRFSVADNPDNSTTEAAVDAFAIVEADCDGEECFGDLDGDNDVDFTDMTILLGAYGTNADGDVDGDGDTDFDDLTGLLGAYGNVCR